MRIKILAFAISFTVPIILAHSRGAVVSTHNGDTPAPQRAIMYALAVPNGVPGFSIKPDREQEHLFGAVKTVKREQFNTAKLLGLFSRTQSQMISSISFNPEGNKTEEINYNSGGATVHTMSYRYDNKGRKIVQVMHQGNIKGETTYTYNQDGREVEALEQVGEKVLTRRRYLATYDAQGNQIAALYSEDKFETKTTYRYDYDKQGHVVELTTLTDEGVIYHRVVYAYDANGNVISKTSYRPDGLVYQKSLFSYDGDRKREETFNYNNDGEQLHMFELYDARGNAIEVGGFDKSGRLSGGKTIRTYVYDRAGNWIKQTVQSVDPATGKLWGEWVEERRIEYY